MNLTSLQCTLKPCVNLGGVAAQAGYKEQFDIYNPIKYEITQH